MNKWIGLLTWFALSALAGDPHSGAAKQEARKETAKKETAKAAAGGGMVVSLDKQRGLEEDPKLSPELLEALARLVNTSSEGLREETRPDGTVVVDLQGRFQSATVVSIGKDGKLRSACYSAAPEHRHGATCKHAAPPSDAAPAQTPAAKPKKR